MNILETQVLFKWGAQSKIKNDVFIIFVNSFYLFIRKDSILGMWRFREVLFINYLIIIINEYT